MDTVLCLLAPILPFLTEAMYQNMVLAADSSRPESVHLNDYPSGKMDIVDRHLVAEMDHIVKLNALALSAREKAGIKIRQPLAALIIAPNTEAESRAVKRFSHLLKSQLNVKTVELRDLKNPCPMDLDVRPSKKYLGQKYKAKSKTITEEIQRQLNAITDSLEQDTRQWEFTVQIDGESICLTRENFLIEEKEPENLSLVKNNDGWLAFDTVLTEELLMEGLMRDFLRQMQVFRKESGLEIEDRIMLSYNTDSPAAKTMMAEYRDTICSELLCLEMQEETTMESPHVINLSGEAIGVTLQKAPRIT
jgi:isoleucyl-tRNA synthetase